MIREIVIRKGKSTFFKNTIRKNIIIFTIKASGAQLGGEGGGLPCTFWEKMS